MGKLLRVMNNKDPPVWNKTRPDLNYIDSSNNKLVGACSNYCMVNVTSHVELDWPAGLKIVPGIARGLDYLHIELSSLEVSHGNLESSNVLLGPDNHPFLSDYGYRRDRSPVCIHDSGEVSPKSDVYCVGIIILKILTGKFPPQYLSHKEDETDVVQLTAPALSEPIQDELLGLGLPTPKIHHSATWRGSSNIGFLCTQTCPEARLELKKKSHLNDKRSYK
ncbi:hypothetical protein GQ457_09G005450 [Hibiscus cannabinus]